MGRAVEGDDASLLRGELQVEPAGQHAGGGEHEGQDAEQAAAALPLMPGEDPDEGDDGRQEQEPPLPRQEGQTQRRARRHRRSLARVFSRHEPQRQQRGQDREEGLPGLATDEGEGLEVDGERGQKGDGAERERIASPGQGGHLDHRPRERDGKEDVGELRALGRRPEVESQRPQARGNDVREGRREELGGIARSGEAAGGQRLRVGEVLVRIVARPGIVKAGVEEHDAVQHRAHRDEAGTRGRWQALPAGARP